MIRASIARTPSTAMVRLYGTVPDLAICPELTRIPSTCKAEALIPSITSRPIEARPKAVFGRPGSVAAYSETRRKPKSQSPSPTKECHPCAALIAMPYRSRAKMNARSGEHPLHTGATKRSKVRTVGGLLPTRGGYACGPSS